jgi:hypothetical protein
MVPLWKETGKKDTKLISSLENIENRVYDEIEVKFLK